MIKIHDAVHSILYDNEEALTALAEGYMNLSQYAQLIQNDVEKISKKPVGVPGIVVALSRIAKKINTRHPLVQDIAIKNITTKTPLSEIVYIKSNESINKLSKIYNKVKTDTDDFLTITLSTNEITVICSNRIKLQIEAVLQDKPIMVTNNLSSVGLSFDEKYYPMPNVTFSLIRKIAQKRIPLAETITTRTEIIFIFEQQYLATIVELFINKH